MNFINDNIAVGGLYDARNLTELKDEGIDAVLNVAKDLDDDYPVPESGAIMGVEYAKVGLSDGATCSLASFLSAVLKLKDLLMINNKVFVHCFAGQSRSVSVVAVYLTVFADDFSDDFIENVKFVMGKRGYARGPSPYVLLVAEKSCKFLKKMFGKSY